MKEGILQENNLKKSWFEEYNIKDSVLKTTFPRPFALDLGNNQWGILRDGNLYLTDPKHSDITGQIITNYEWLVKEMDNRSSGGGSYDPIHVDYMSESLGKFDDLILHSKVIKPEDISLGSKDKNPEILYKEFGDYLALIQESNLEKVEHFFNIKIKELSIAEQFYFLNFIKNKNTSEIKPIKDFTYKYKTNGFRTFLSIEHGGKEMGDKILTLGEKLPEESAKTLFKTYGEMINASEEVGTLLIENLGEKATPELVNQAKESLLVGGKNLLENYANKASTCEGVKCEELGQELKERLELAKTSVFAFSYACKTLVEQDAFSFEDFKKAKLSYDKSPIPEKMREEIVAMHKENTKQYPEGLREYWRGTLRKGLEKANPKQMVVSVSYEDSVVSAMRVIEQEDGSWYGASFNVNPTVMGSKIGTELLKKVIEDLAKDKPFIADCYADNPMLKTYTEKFGFQITGTKENYENTGAKVYQITLYPKKKDETK